MSKPTIDRALPVFTEPHGTTDEQCSACVTHVNAMQSSTEWAAAQAVLGPPAATWQKTSDDLKKKAQALEDLLKKADAARVDVETLGRQWMSDARVCLGVVNQYCKGSKDKVKALGWGVAGHQAVPPASEATNLRQKSTKLQGLVIAAWNGDGHRRMYQVQTCTNPADPTTYSALHTTSRRVFKLTGQVPGAPLHVRVVVLDPKLPTGQTAWTAWLALTVG